MSYRGRRIKQHRGQKATYPIKSEKELDRVMRYLWYKKEHSKSKIKEYQAYRNYIMFLIGLNTAFRAEDLLQLRTCDVIKGHICIKENKRKKIQNFEINKQLYEDIKRYINTYEFKDSDYLFMGQKKKDTYKGITRKVIYPITEQNTRNIFRDVAANCGIGYPFGLHSLRKTYGYQLYSTGMDLLTIQQMYGHDDPITTLAYICWDQFDISRKKTAVYIGGINH